MVDVLEISAIVAAAGVLAGVAYYILDMRNQAKNRKTDLIMRLYSTWSTDEYLHALMKFMTAEFKDHKDFREKYASPDGFSEDPVNLARLKTMTFYQGLGVLLKMKLIDIKLTERLFATSPIYTWEKMKPIIEGTRIKYKNPQYCAEYECLYDEMKKREQKLKSQA